MAADLGRRLPEDLGQVAVGAKAGRRGVGHAKEVAESGVLGVVPLVGNGARDMVRVAAAAAGRTVTSKVLAVATGTLVPR